AGIKPLFYAELPDGGLAFASELGPILQHPKVDRTPSPEGYLSYFFSDYFQPPHTAIKGAKQLPPGHYLVWENGKLSAPIPFFRLPTPHDPHASDRELAQETWKKLEASVDRQLIADVPVGIFLSGGLDSSSVAVLAAKHAKNRMKAFAIGFEDPTFDEVGYARQVASRIGVDFVTETLRERDLIDVAEDALAMLDEPLADASFLPTFLLSKLAAKHVKVVVGGDGGDELFGGYPTYKAHRYARIYRKFPSILRSRLIPRAVGMLPVRHRYQSLEWKLKRFTGRWDDDVAVLHQRWMSNVDLPDLARLLPKSHGLPQTLRTDLPRYADEIERVMALDFSTYMSGSVLTKVDRAAMAHGLEVRPPILDNEMIDWAFSLPARFKVRNDTTKFLFKKAARGYVPNDIIDRPKKGFGVPIAAWLRTALKDRVEAIFASSPVWDTGFVDKHVFTTWKNEHMEGAVDRSKPLWSLFVLDRWMKTTG
ncbi:MAG TPA: asparagine synthase (glutamine-hydrolyzing), partial [Polyangiaceae bacterium]